MSEYTPIIDRAHPSHWCGRQQVYRFANGYGASVVQTPYSYGGDRGLYELAVLRFKGDDYLITYDTPVTNDVLGYLASGEVQDALKAIDALPMVPA